MSPGQRISLLAGVVTTIAVATLVSSTRASRLSCEGAVTVTGDVEGLTSRPASLAATVETRRWFARWTRSESTIAWEVQPGGYSGQGYYAPDPFRSRIRAMDGLENQGSWSPASRQLSVQLRPGRLETFDGICQ